MKPLLLSAFSACLCSAAVITVPTGQPQTDVQIPYPLVNDTGLVPAVVQTSAPQDNVAFNGNLIYYLPVYRPQDLVVPTAVLGPTPDQGQPPPVAYIVNVLTPQYQPPAPDVPQVPEPGTLAMVAIGAGLLLIHRRK